MSEAFRTQNVEVIYTEQFQERRLQLTTQFFRDVLDVPNGEQLPFFVTPDHIVVVEDFLNELIEGHNMLFDYMQGFKFSEQTSILKEQKSAVHSYGEMLTEAQNQLENLIHIYVAEYISPDAFTSSNPASPSNSAQEYSLAMRNLQALLKGIPEPGWVWRKKERDRLLEFLVDHMEPGNTRNTYNKALENYRNIAEGNIQVLPIQILPLPKRMKELLSGAGFESVGALNRFDLTNARYIGNSAIFQIEAAMQAIGLGSLPNKIPRK